MANHPRVPTRRAVEMGVDKGNFIPAGNPEEAPTRRYNALQRASGRLYGRDFVAGVWLFF